MIFQIIDADNDVETVHREMMKHIRSIISEVQNKPLLEFSWQSLQVLKQGTLSLKM